MKTTLIKIDRKTIKVHYNIKVTVDITNGREYYRYESVGKEFKLKIGRNGIERVTGKFILTECKMYNTASMGKSENFGVNIPKEDKKGFYTFIAGDNVDIKISQIEGREYTSNSMPWFIHKQLLPLFYFDYKYNDTKVTCKYCKFRFSYKQLKTDCIDTEDGETIKTIDNICPKCDKANCCKIRYEKMTKTMEKQYVK